MLLHGLGKVDAGTFFEGIRVNFVEAFLRTLALDIRHEAILLLFSFGECLLDRGRAVEQLEGEDLAEGREQGLELLIGPVAREVLEE